MRHETMVTLVPRVAVFKLLPVCTYRIHVTWPGWVLLECGAPLATRVSLYWASAPVLCHFHRLV